MPNFVSSVEPGINLVGNVLKSKIQQCIADEYEAASRYRAIAEISGDENVKKIMNSIADEEIVHVGEFHHLLQSLFPEEVALEQDGVNEASNLIIGDEEGPEDEKKVEKEEKKSDCNQKIKVIRILKK